MTTAAAIIKLPPISDDHHQLLLAIITLRFVVSITGHPSECPWADQIQNSKVSTVWNECRPNIIFINPLGNLERPLWLFLKAKKAKNIYDHRTLCEY